MQITHSSIATALAIPIVIWIFSLINWVWFRPKKLEKCLRKQGLKGNSYKLLFGDLKEYFLVTKLAMSKPIDISDNVVPRVMPLDHKSVDIYGKNSFIWIGPTPRVNIMEPELIKEILTKPSLFNRVSTNPLAKLLANGIVRHEGEKWAKHRKIMNPAFHFEKLKLMLPAFYVSCDEMVHKWENIVPAQGSCELDVIPYLKTLTADALSRTAFGSNYEEGKKIFELQNEQAALVMEATNTSHISGWRFIPTKRNKRMRTIWKEVQGTLLNIINKRVTLMKEEGNCNDDLLGLLLKSNMEEIQEHGNNEKVGLSIDDVIEECKLFYLVGQESLWALLAWTMILLSQHQNWQQCAREEVLNIFGDNNPDYDGLNRLKTVPMILLEVLRLYPTPIAMTRTIKQDVKLGKLNLPAGINIYIPSIMVHCDRDIWGDDANKFNPEKFSQGMSKATNNQVSFLPFGWGPKTCIGQNYAMLQAKMAISMILQCFHFDISSSYVHAPVSHISLKPQYGAQLKLFKLESLLFKK